MDYQPVDEVVCDRSVVLPCLGHHWSTVDISLALTQDTLDLHADINTQSYSLLAMPIIIQHISSWEPCSLVAC